MENLIRFFQRFSALLLFIVLEIIAIVLMVNRNNYHLSMFMNSSNAVSGGFYQMSNGVTEYFGLRHKNEGLSDENNRLKNENQQLRKQLAAYQSLKDKRAVADTLVPVSEQYTYIRAKVINNTVNNFQNYLTINKGLRDGIRPDMGVVCADGVVGIVMHASQHYSVVLSMLNPNSRISSRLDSCRNFGSVVWDGLNPDRCDLIEIPRHAKVHEGEKVITSGFSSIFPEGIPVGTVHSIELKPSDNFYNITIDLATDFRRLSYVEVIAYTHRDEMVELEKEVKK
ncbi:MAG: rod shape-determining protein MreC [Paludibacteraceae bacterium]|nr:rod shape-determining protein MreC [Paludibacteraceae bacterium]